MHGRLLGLRAEVPGGEIDIHMALRRSKVTLTRSYAPVVLCALLELMEQRSFPYFLQVTHSSLKDNGLLPMSECLSFEHDPPKRL